jgi:hypothetical protein
MVDASIGSISLLPEELFGLGGPVAKEQSS